MNNFNNIDWLENKPLANSHYYLCLIIRNISLTKEKDHQKSAELQIFTEDIQHSVSFFQRTKRKFQVTDLVRMRERERERERERIYKLTHGIFP
jgi:hypothetical protein